MAGKYYLLSDEEVQLIKWTIDQARTQRKNTPPESSTPQDNFPSLLDMYVALTPVGGIPALNQAAGTGSSPDGTGDLPGAAVCPLYKMNLTTGFMEQMVNNATKTVNNLSALPIAGFTWVFVQKDKWGTYYALPTALISIKIGKFTTTTSQFGVATVAIWDLIAGHGLNGLSDLYHTGSDQTAFMLLGPSVLGAWCIMVGWNGAYLAVNMECNSVGTGT